MTKIIFFDIDGTLVSLTKKVASRATVESLRRLREKGILTYIATGHDRGEIRGERLLEGMEFDGYLLNNGHVAYDHQGRLLYSLPLDSGDVNRTLDWVQTHEQPCWITTEHGSCLNFVTPRVVTVMESIHTALPRLGDIRQAASGAVYKIVLFLTEQELKEPLSLLSNCRQAQFHHHAFDLMHKDGGKGAGALRILEKLGIPREQSMAFGDGDNDVDLLRAVGMGVAMGNAPDYVKQAADYVAPHVDQEGLARALEELVFSRLV